MCSGTLTYSPKVAAEPENFFVNMKFAITNCFYTNKWQNRCLQTSVDAYVSSKGNNQYMRLPMRVPKMDMCSYLNNQYRKYIMPSMKPPAADYFYTDVKGKDICQMMKDDGGVCNWKQIKWPELSSRLFSCRKLTLWRTWLSINLRCPCSWPPECIKLFSPTHMDLMINWWAFSSALFEFFNDNVV